MLGHPSPLVILSYQVTLVVHDSVMLAVRSQVFSDSAMQGQADCHASKQSFSGFILRCACINNVSDF